MRIVSGPFEVAGVAGAIARGLRARGHESSLVVREPHPFGLEVDRITGEGYLGRAAFGATAGWRNDVIHLHFGTSWCEFLDVAWWRVAGRPLVVMHYHGDDVRLREIALREHPARGRVFDETPNRDERTTRRRLRWASRVCHAAIVGDLELASYVTPVFDAVYVVPVAVEFPLPRSAAATASASGAVPVVLHAPSHNVVKGTKYVKAAFAALEGRLLTSRLVEGVPHEEVLAEIANADIVVDQLNSVTYGVFAIEAMWLGKPVLVEFDRARLAPQARDAPLVPTSPGTLESDLAALIGDPDRMRAVGAAGRPFVERVHATSVIVEDVEAVYRHARTRPRGLFEVRDGAIRSVRC